MVNSLLRTPSVAEGMGVPFRSVNATTDPDYASLASLSPAELEATFVGRFLDRHLTPRYAKLLRDGVFPDTDPSDAAAFSGTLDATTCDPAADLTISVPSDKAGRAMAQLIFLADLSPEERATLPPVDSESDEPTVVRTREIHIGLAKVAQLVAKEMAAIPGRYRSLSLANFIESLAYWASSPDGHEVPTVLKCMARARVTPPVFEADGTLFGKHSFPAESAAAGSQFDKSPKPK